MDICDCDFGSDHHRMLFSGENEDFIFFESGSADNETGTGHPYDDICESYEKYNLAKHYLIFISLVRDFCCYEVYFYFQGLLSFFAFEIIMKTIFAIDSYRHRTEIVDAIVVIVAIIVTGRSGPNYRRLFLDFRIFLSDHKIRKSISFFIICLSDN